MRFGTLGEHLADLRAALADVERQGDVIDRWGAELARILGSGGRLLTAGNGGSAAEAQHLSAELVGRFDDEHRRPLSAIALPADTSTLTAIANDYGYEHVFARQIQAHGRAGDVLVLLSTSGRSPNLLSAATTAHRHGLRVWALTGPGPNPLTRASYQSVTVEAGTSAVQEAHLVLVHALCAAVERRLPHLDRDDARASLHEGTARDTAELIAAASS